MTMTKKSTPPQSRHVIWFGWKLVVILSITLCIFALLRLHLQSDFSYSPRRSPTSRRSFLHFAGPPKIAFLFLVRRDLPLDFLWGSFFENADVANFSIFIHSTPGFEFDESTTRSRFFYGRQLKNSIQVGWGESSMIEAERLLLAAALEDPANQRFVLLSDSCVPLYNFSYIYGYLMASPRSYVDSFINPKDERYNRKMSPIVKEKNWRKGSQWITLVRSHAEAIVDDDVVFPAFKKYCKLGLPPDILRGKLNYKPKKGEECIADEHYVPTFFLVAGLEGELERRTLTYTVWNKSVSGLDSKGWHPITFTYANSGPKKIKEIKAINHVYYASEYRTEWCRLNSTSVPCFLFARKFSRGAAMRLLSEGVVGPFDASALLAASG